MSRFMLVVLLVLTAQVTWSKNMERGPVRDLRGSLDVANPQDENYVLNNGWLAFNHTNYGYFGNNGPSQAGALEDWCDDRWAPQFEYPYGSGVQYLFQGALWIGAEIETDSGYVTRVSVGTDGWQNPSINEYHAGNAPDHGIVLRSNLEGARDCLGNDIYDPTAKSNFEAVAVYTDTLTDPLFVMDDPEDGAHAHLGLEITQTARLWYNPEYARFVIYEFKVKNIGQHNLRNVFLGLYTDSDVGQAGQQNEHTDDISGSILVDSIQGTILGWSADNDGYPDEGFGPPLVLPHSMGVAALTNQFELGNREFANSFNWWLPNGDVTQDFGPAWSDGPDWTIDYGSPVGDSPKYHLLANRERDYDQAVRWIDQPAQLDTMYDCSSTGLPHEWRQDIPPPFEFPTGYDTRFMLSYGPLGELDHFDEDGNCITRLNPGEEFTFTIVMLIGGNFHDPEHPQQQNQGLDTSLFNLDGLVDSYRKAKRVYDSNYSYQPMPPVRNLHIWQALDQAVPLWWEAPGFGDPIGYKIFGRPDSGRGPEVEFTPEPIPGHAYTVRGLNNGDWWQFTIEVIDEEGNPIGRDTLVRVGEIPNSSTLSGKFVPQGDSLYWTPIGDPLRTGYKLVRTSAADTVVYENIQTRNFVDSTIVTGRSYTYRMYIENALGVEGMPTNEVVLMPYRPHANILVFDETKTLSGPDVQRGGVSDTLVRQWYETLLQQTDEEFDYIEADNTATLPTSELLAQYEIVIWHSENTRTTPIHFAEARDALLDEYVSIGGKLMRSGRSVFRNAGFSWPLDYDVTWGTLTFDSIFVSRNFSAPNPDFATRTTGATAMDTTFPSFDWDSTKVSSIRFTGQTYAFLPEIDLMWPNGDTHSLYTINMHESDSTGYADAPCAVVGHRTILFGFPLYFIPEAQAQEILEASLHTLRTQVLETPEPPVEPLPTNIALRQNYPNPFNPSTVIEFDLPVARDGELNVYNIRGQLVSTLLSGALAAGSHRVQFDAQSLASGLYFYRLELGQESLTRKMLLLK